eukprot:TRINITY_DN11948_c0_g1_i1.p1 TRINITY_DN11948_c0_g1~~TRINITY_DN11948_c0_g1_i1.p1  ORF type:complete len:2240 (+),score=276.54 TRINITY_DN11948_c0_g1_i1:702-6722(+)
MSSNTCASGARCPMCFIATSLSADVTIEIVKCSTTRVSSVSTLTSSQMGEFVFINNDANNMLTIRAKTAVHGSTNSVYYLPPASSVAGLCYGGASDKMHFPSSNMEVGTATHNTYDFNGKTITDLGTVQTANIDGGTIDGTTIGATTPAAGTFTDLTSNGNTVVGSNALDTVTVNAEILNYGGNNVFAFEGATSDGFEITMQVEDPTSEITVTLPAETGTLLTSSSPAANSMTSASSLATVGNMASGSIVSGFGSITTANAVTSGDLTSNGNTILGSDAADTLTLNGVIQNTNAMTFEGNTADANELTIAIADPTADHTVTIPAETGTVITTASLNADTMSSATSLSSVGALTTGSIASGFGTISTTNSITTTAAVTSGDLTANGNVVLGSDDADTVTVNGVVNNYAGNKFMILEGATADANELTLEIADPGADHTITIPAETGTFITSASTTAAGLTTTANLATVGALSSGSIASGFGSITTANAVTSGDLTANGNVILGSDNADSVTVNGEINNFNGNQVFIFEGATVDTKETVFEIADPTAERTITLPDETGTIITSGSTTAAGLTTTANLATVGALSSGSIASGFGSITTANAVTCGDMTANGNVALGSDLADTVTVNGEILNFAGNKVMVFEGSTTSDNFETTIEIVDPSTGDQTIHIPAETGTFLTSASTTAAGLTTAGNLANVGAMVSGSIASGFGTISTANSITTSAAVTSGDLTANGNVVLGSDAVDTVTVNGVINNFGGNNVLVFEGSTADANEMTIQIADPGADHTITIPAETGTFITSASTAAAGLTTTSNLATVGALSSGSIATGFGSITTANAVTSGDLTSNGNTVVGSDDADTFQVNAAIVNFNANNALVFEGATADTAELTIAIADPSSDKTITFPDETGTVLTSTTPAANSMTSATSLASVGALASGSIASGFGTISTANAITTTATLTSQDFASNGNTVLGDAAADTLTVNAEIFNYAGNKALIFEGATTNDNYEITLEIEDPTLGDFTVTLPAETGTLLTSSTAAANSMTSASSLATVGALASGSIASGFGSITTANAITGGDVTANGNVVLGSNAVDTLTLNAEIINFGGNKVMAFQGATNNDNKEITIEVADPTAGDQTIMIPAETGTFITSASTHAAGLTTASSLATTGTLTGGNIDTGFGYITTTNTITGEDITANGNVILGSNAADTLKINAVIQETNVMAFEGNTADANEIGLAVVDPGADHTVTIPAETGTILTSASTTAAGLTTAGVLANVGPLSSGTIVSGFGTISTLNNIATTAHLSSGDFTANGNAIIGSTDADTIQIHGTILQSKVMSFEGNTVDGNEIHLVVADPSTDNTITMPAETGTIFTSATATAVTLATASNLVTVGALSSGSIASGFGSITTANAITGGDLTANGNVILGSNAADTLTVNAEIQNFAGNKVFVFEGATTGDTYETTLEVEDPTSADITLTMPAETGTFLTSSSNTAAGLTTASNLVTVGALASGSIASGFGSITTANAVTSGDLTSNGNTVLGNAATDLLTVNAVIQNTNALVFEGNTADANEITLAVADPGSSITVTIPAETGTVLTSSTIAYNNLQSATSLVSVGALASGSIASGFGSITTANAITGGDVTANGNIVLGSDGADTLTVNAVLQNTNALIFEGNTADGFEQHLAITDPTNDRTVTIPDETGTFITSASTNAASLQTAANLNTVGALATGSIASGFGTISTANSITTTAAITSGDLTSNGNTVVGSDLTDTVTVNGVLQNEAALTFEGSSVDNNELTLKIADPGSDVTVTIPAETGTIVTTASLAATALTTAGNLATVGALSSGSIATGFGTISTANAITTTADLTGNNFRANGNVQLGADGTDTVIVSGVILNTQVMHFEGNTVDDNELFLAVAEPGADVTVTIPAETGTLITTSSLTSALTTVGALASGSIASGFGTISTGNTISTTSTMSTGNGGVYVDGVRVLGPQVSAIASLGSLGLSTTAEIEAAVNAILSALRSHGLINTPR